jgi:UDP-N-acetylglucosamine acyltransferase
VADRNVVSGLNLVGLKRRGWPREVIVEIKEAFRAVMRPTGNMRTAAAEWLPQARSEQVRVFLEFFAGGKRSIARPRRDREGDA